MLIKRVNAYDPVKECYQSCDIRINSNIIEDVSAGLTEKDSEPWVDLAGYFAYPGIIDSHVHLIGTGKSLVEPSIQEIKVFEELKHVILCQDSEIISLRGWPSDQAPFLLNKQRLDDIMLDRPVLIIGKCGHVGYVNSAAIACFQLESLSSLDGSDLSSGLIRERVLDRVRGSIVYSHEQLKTYLNKGARHFKSFGITSVHSDDWNASTSGCLLSALDAQNDIRIYEHINLSPPFSMDSFIRKGGDKELWRDSPFLSINSLKFILDGSLGGRSAFLKDPYHDRPCEYGVLYYQENELRSILEQAEKIQWASNFHVIGDAALETILKAMSFAFKKNNPLRHRLIHLQMASIQQIELMGRLGLHLSIQPLFYSADLVMAEKRLGKTRLDSMGYPFQKLLHPGITLSLSTDAPVESANPFYNLSIAEQFMTRKKAFYCYTAAGAISAFQENKLGKILPGHYADIFFLKEDLFSISSEKLAFVRPDLLLFNGEWYDINHHLENKKSGR